MIGRLEVSCELCQRHGVYLVDRLMVKFGDVSIPEAILVTHLQRPEIWRRGLRPLWADIVDLVGDLAAFSPSKRPVRAG
jgi:hypothetical protein